MSLKLPVATELAFEAYTEQTLLVRGWARGTNAEWNVDLGLFPPRVFAFLQHTQQALWDALRAQHGANLEPMLLATLVKELEAKGSLEVLRHGFKFYGKTFRLAYFKPAHGVNPETLELYGHNQLTVTRQVPCHPGDHATLDMVLAVNGLPVATIELKNPATGQTWRNAVLQYQKDRRPGAPIFAFKKRALVHFAVDPNEVWMTTRLAGDKTHFLPFNRGSAPGQIVCGAGNPAHPSGHPTGYLWEEVLERESFLEILGQFLIQEKKDEKVDDGRGGQRLVTKEAIIFPRYHQLTAVRRLIDAARREGAGHNYLIQHSAGSGKTNSISWLSHRLASLHNEGDEKLFDAVIVVTDRVVLDRQLQDAIYQIDHAHGVVAGISEGSRQLSKALVDDTKIIVVTLQTFPFVLRALIRSLSGKRFDELDEDERGSVMEEAAQYGEKIANRRYAVIVDEAHSSQTGETARELRELLGNAVTPTGDDEPDWEDRLNQVMESRGQQTNLSFFAFTATPKGKTLEFFGRPGDSGKPEPFHLYSLRQAIEEGFILDVVRNYTTYATYYRLVKAIEDDPDLPKKKAARALAKFMTLHPHNLEQKTEVIVEHFRQKVRTHLGGRAKAMVVTSSRLHAVRYMQTFQRYLKDHGYTDIRPLVAFSGTVKDPETGLEYTEPRMNTDCVSNRPIGEKQLPERFNSPDYQVLLVANKYQTGFDQPLLCAMYVDKRLDGVQAVQTLSRLNRMIPGKVAPFVLDFVNEAEDIYRAFRPYYDATSLQETSDPHRLEQLKHELNGLQVYHWSEVEAFARVFYQPIGQQSVNDHARLRFHLQPAIDRFRAMEEDELRTAFRDKLGGYVRIYAFLSHIMPWNDPELEMLYSYGHSLLPHLPMDRDTEPVKLGEEVALQYYRLQRTHEGVINLAEGDSEPVKSPTDIGTGRTKEEKALLSEIIKVLNERFGTNFADEDRFFFEQIRERAVANERVVKLRQANPFDKFQLGLKQMLEDLMIERMAENDKIVTRYMDDKDFGTVAFAVLSKGWT